MQLEIGTDPEEVGRARRWARSRLEKSGIGADEPLADTLLLLVSELVTNAVVHTGAPAVLRMLLPGRPEPGAVRLEVADTSSRPPRPRRAEGDDTDGRGLELVSGLADRWGWRLEGAGKSIWCELDRAEGVDGCAAAVARTPVVPLPAAVPGCPESPGGEGGAAGAAALRPGSVRVQRA